MLQALIQVISSSHECTDEQLSPTHSFLHSFAPERGAAWMYSCFSGHIQRLSHFKQSPSGFLGYKAPGGQQITVWTSKSSCPHPDNQILSKRKINPELSSVLTLRIGGAGRVPAPRGSWRRRNASLGERGLGQASLSRVSFSLFMSLRLPHRASLESRVFASHWNISQGRTGQA